MVEIHPVHARAVLSELALGLVLLDQTSSVSWVNAYAENLIGLPAEHLLGRKVTDLALPYSSLDPGEEIQVRVDGALIGITQRYDHAGARGTILMILDRGHTLVWFLSALSSGVPGAVAASGILSRGATTNRLEAEVSRSRRYSNPLSCISIAVSGASEETLGQIARTLKGQLRWVDLLGQWRDDVLLAVLPETDAPAASQLAAKLSEAIALSDQASDNQLAVGYASWLRGDSAEQMVERALVGAKVPAPIARVLPLIQPRDR